MPLRYLEALPSLKTVSHLLQVLEYAGLPSQHNDIYLGRCCHSPAGLLWSHQHGLGVHDHTVHWYHGHQVGVGDVLVSVVGGGVVCRWGIRDFT